MTDKVRPRGAATGSRVVVQRPETRSLLNLLGEAFRHPGLWVTLALFANVGEGALRKWMPGFGGGIGRLLAYFSKDFIFALGAVLVWGVTEKRKPSGELFRSWVVVAWGLIVIGGMISSMQAVNFVGAGLTLRALFFLPLFVMVFSSRLKGFPLLGAASVTVLLAFVNLPLSLLQSQLPSEHALNRYAAEEAHIVEVAYGVRATGTFAYITGLGVMSAAGIWAGLVVLSLGRGWKFQLLGMLGLLSGLGCAFASVSRGAVVVALAMIALWVMSSVKTVKLMGRMVWYGTAMCVMALVLMPGLSERFLHMGEGAFDRFESAGDSNTGRVLNQWSEMWQALTLDPMGRGLGTEQVGGNVAATGVARFTNYEYQFPRIVMELGILGLIGFFILVAGTVLALQQAKRDYPLAGFPLAMTATQLFFLSQGYSSLMVNHTASAFVWLAVAAALAAVPAARRNEGKRRRFGRRRRETGISCTKDDVTKADSGEAWR